MDGSTTPTTSSQSSNNPNENELNNAEKLPNKDEMSSSNNTTGEDTARWVFF